MKERYLHSVRSCLLDCPVYDRERLLLRLNSAITTYLEDVPEAVEADLIFNFGTPEDCATRLLNECTPKVIVAERQRKKRCNRLVMTLLLVFLAFTIGIAVYLWRNGGLVIIQRGGELPDSSTRGQITYSFDE